MYPGPFQGIGYLLSQLFLGGDRVSLVSGPFWGVGYLLSQVLSEGVGYTQPQPPAPPRVVITTAVGTYPTGMLSCLRTVDSFQNTRVK